jgi:hypothetical protein
MKGTHGLFNMQHFYKIEGMGDKLTKRDIIRALSEDHEAEHILNIYVEEKAAVFLIGNKRIQIDTAKLAKTLGLKQGTIKITSQPHFNNWEAQKPLTMQFRWPLSKQGQAGRASGASWADTVSGQVSTKGSTATVIATVDRTNTLTPMSGKTQGSLTRSESKLSSSAATATPTAQTPIQLDTPTTADKTMHSNPFRSLDTEQDSEEVSEVSMKDAKAEVTQTTVDVRLQKLEDSIMQQNAVINDKFNQMMAAVSALAQSHTNSGNDPPTRNV